MAVCREVVDSMVAIFRCGAIAVLKGWCTVERRDHGEVAPIDPTTLTNPTRVSYDQGLLACESNRIGRSKICIGWRQDVALGWTKGS